MEIITQNIVRFQSVGDAEGLRKTIIEYDKEKLNRIISALLPSSSFPSLWDFLLTSFQNTTEEFCSKQIEIILVLLKQLETRDSLSAHLASTLIQRLCMELVKLRIDHLVDIFNFCLGSIQSNEVLSSVSWKELLPDLLRILSAKDMINYDGMEYTGQEFMTNYINTLCMSNLPVGKITEITAMFSDVSLNKEEHFKMTNKLASYIEKLTPQEVPPFVYQLMKFCRNQNSRIVFLKLQKYFDLRIYKNNNLINSHSSESSPDLDLIENAEDHDVLDAESIVLFHIQSAASIGHKSIKEYLNSLKAVEKSPDFVLHPFQLLALFTIATINLYEEDVFDIIRHSVVRYYNEQLKRDSSIWYREIIDATKSPEEVFGQIISIGDKELITEALVRFGYVLLNVGSALGKDVIAEKQWTLGTIILLKIIKRKRNVASVLLSTFCNHILTRASAVQYIDCLYFLNKSSPLLMLENQSCIVELIDSLINMSSPAAKQLLEALMPLMKVSPSIRDTLILILRKCLYSRSIEARKVAVYGFTKLISSLKLTSNGVLSQTSNESLSSGYSLYTQITLSRTTQSASASHFSNEALCCEILEILKRCFSQQAEVKLHLYDCLFNAVSVNPELGIPVLDMLWFHFMEFYVIDDQSPSPLNFLDVAILRDSDALLQEPLGKFIFTLCQILVRTRQSEDDRDNPLVVNYAEILDSLCGRMTNCELAHFDLDDGTDLTDILPESQQKMHVLKEIINVYEALICYRFSTLSRSLGVENQCTIINGLFQGISRFAHFGKNSAKSNKKGKKSNRRNESNKEMSQKSAAGDGGETDKGTQSNCSKNNQQKPVLKGFKTPDTLMDLATVETALKILLESDIEWVPAEEANIIRTKTDLHRHCLQALLQLIAKFKQYKSIDGAYQKDDFSHVASIASTLYNRIIKRFSDYVDFDCSAAVLSVECFHAILQLVNYQYKKKIVKFLSIVDKKEELSLVELLQPLLEEFEKLFETDADEFSSDAEIKKLPLALLNNISLLCSFIPNNSNVLSVQVYDWLKSIAYNNSIPHKVAGNFMNLICEIHLRYRQGLTLFEDASASFVTIYGSLNADNTIEENDESLKIVNAGSANAVFQSLCSYNKNVMDDLDSIITRMKSDYCILTYLGVDNEKKRNDKLKTSERGALVQLCFVARILCNLTLLALPPGSLCDALFKNIIQFYLTLTSMTKYFITKSNKGQQSFQEVWYEKLVKLAGKKLGPAIYVFIYELESGTKEEEESSKKKLQGSALKNKILKETKLIPKVIYEIEQFGKYVIQLSKKTKCDLSKYVGQGTARDFRINREQMKAALEQGNQSFTQETSPSTSREGASLEVNDEEGDIVMNSEEENEATTHPPAKKLRV